jgi:hypothetical protein
MFPSTTAYSYVIGFYGGIGFYFLGGLYLGIGLYLGVGFYVATRIYLTLGYYLDYGSMPYTAHFNRPSNMPYQLAICEVFHPVFHGQDANSTPGIHSHFLVYATVDLADFYRGAYLHETNSLRRYRHAIQLLHGMQPHPSIRNYGNLVTTYMRLEIIQADVLVGGEEVAYLKTFWLRLVQRRWKKIYQARKEIIQKRSAIKALQERQRTGQWPMGLRRLPSLREPSLREPSL